MYDLTCLMCWVPVEEKMNMSLKRYKLKRLWRVKSAVLSLYFVL